MLRYFISLYTTWRLAKKLFPKEKWVKTEPHIWVAATRLAERTREPEKWEKEMSQVRILTARGSVAVFIAEKKKEDRGGDNKKYADTLIDGEIMEMKTISGNRTTLGTEFRRGYKQGAELAKANGGRQRHSVFIRLLSDLPEGSVKAKIAGELKNRLDSGSFICYFEASGELKKWAFKELKAMIGK
jgi:hypothetical protein